MALAEQDAGVFGAGPLKVPGPAPPNMPSTGPRCHIAGAGPRPKIEPAPKSPETCATNARDQLQTNVYEQYFFA